MDRELSELAVKIREYCGIDYTENHASMQQKITRRLAQLGLDLKGYLLFLEKHPKEWDKLVEFITINETYFFREYPQLEEFQHLIRNKKAKEIRVWCIPCSTGEEAYSLAILGKELEASTGTKVRIVASDLNKKVLEHAKQGCYPKKSMSFRRLPEDKGFLEKYFNETELNYEVKDEIKQMVSFEPFNLTDYYSYAKYSQMDFIFCRNVLFYLNEESIRNIIARFFSTLKSDGYLFLGHAESISGMESGFVPVHTKQTFYYRKGKSPNSIWQHEGFTMNRAGESG